ncbi:MAG: chemotaxis protein CheW [Acidobacteria bacterium]|nr:chemotaxis protein CheW [Acidobacteriota bacterium]
MVILSFELGGERFGIPSTQIDEVALPVRVYPFPDAPPIVEGMIHYRGSAVPLVNLRSRFGLSGKERGSQEKLVVARIGSGRVALRADDVLGLMDVDPGDIEEQQGGSIRSRYIAAVAKLEDGLILIHDLESLLDSDETDWLKHSATSVQEDPT